MSEKQSVVEAQRQTYLGSLYSQAINIDASEELSKIALG